MIFGRTAPSCRLFTSSVFPPSPWSSRHSKEAEATTRSILFGAPEPSTLLQGLANAKDDVDTRVLAFCDLGFCACREARNDILLGRRCQMCRQASFSATSASVSPYFVLRSECPMRVQEMFLALLTSALCRAHHISSRFGCYELATPIGHLGGPSVRRLTV